MRSKMSNKWEENRTLFTPKQVKIVNKIVNQSRQELLEEIVKETAKWLSEYKQETMFVVDILVKLNEIISKKKK